MKLDGTLRYIAAGAQRMVILDVSNPAAPKMVSQFSLSGAPVWDVSPQGSFAVLSADVLGLVTLDVSNPAHPLQLAQQALPFLNPFPAPNTGAGIVPASCLAFQNGLTYVGTWAGLEFVFDAAAPANPRLMAVNTLGVDDLSVISVMTPGKNQLYVAIDGTVTQIDNSVPQNSIKLYYPPAALSKGYPIGDGMLSRTRSKHNPKQRFISHGWAANPDSPDRFGVRHGMATVRRNNVH